MNIFKAKNKTKTLNILRSIYDSLDREHWNHSPLGYDPNSKLNKSIGSALNSVRRQIEVLEAYGRR